MKRTKEVSIVSTVRQVIEMQDIAAVNVMIALNRWILLGTYCNLTFSAKKQRLFLGE